MSGKSKKTSGWGGKRSGSGPKPKYMMSSNQIKKMLARMRKAKRETGVDEDEFLVNVISEGKSPDVRDQNGEIITPGEKADIKERLAATKIFKDYTMSKHTEKDINITDARGPKIGLPEMKPDPAKLIPIDGGKKDVK